LREAILNSIIHKKYEGTTIFLSVYDDRLTIWNPGGLPDDLTMEQLKNKHRSIPRNRLIADVFFMAGYIEAWGRGIEVMQEGCRGYGIPDPVIIEEEGGIEVTFLKDIYTEENLRQLNLNERQIKAILYIKDHRELTNTNYQTINKISKPVATRDLTDLVNRGLILKIGSTGKGTKYMLVRSKGLTKGSNGS
jgi:ATP-dependent DNA helicase RecG